MSRIYKFKNPEGLYSDNLVVWSGLLLGYAVLFAKKLEPAKGQLVAVTINENGEAIEKPLNISAEEAKNKMITNSDGDALVVNSKGEAMGVTEFQETGGGNTRLMKNYNKEKESKELAPSTMVTFSSHPTQNYGFDSYTEQKSLIQNNYPVLENGHRPAFKSVESFKYDKVAVSSAEGLTFRDEMGIPSATVDGGISLSGASHGSTKALYAYREKEDKIEEIVGKLSVVSFDNEPKRVHIIPVNDAELPSASELEATLTHIYKQAVATWTVLPEEKVSVDFPNGIMTHEGSGTFSTYNKDQNAIANAYKASNRKFEPGDIYLFFIKEATFKERSLAGFMPLQRQIGFIYGSPSLEVVAHELAHGTFNLRHTFSPEAFIEAERKTQNLMDYAGGTELWKHQWDLIHNPESILFAWGQDEEEGAMIFEDRCWDKRHDGWKKNYPELYSNKKKLRYVESCSYMYDSDLWRTYYKLADGNVLMVDQVRKDVNSSDVEPSIHSLYLADKGEFILIDINTFDDDCLSCDLDLLAKHISAKTGKIVGRYVLPLEDMFILVYGEDFDGEEASRIAAGGFILLEVVQVGKIFKLAKGAKLFKAGKAISPGARVVQQFTKKTSEQTLANIAAQLTMHYILETVNAQFEPDVGIDDIFFRAVGKVNVKEAFISSMINFASLDNNTRNAFECALRMAQGIDEHTNDFSFGLTVGTRNCLINLGITLIGQRLVGTSAYNQLKAELAETVKYDFVRQQLSILISQEALDIFTQTFMTTGVENTLKD